MNDYGRPSQVGNAERGGRSGFARTAGFRTSVVKPCDVLQQNALMNPEPGRDGALRRPRRVQRRNDAARCFAGGDIAARCPYQSQIHGKGEPCHRLGNAHRSVTLLSTIEVSCLRSTGRGETRSSADLPGIGIKARRNLAPPILVNKRLKCRGVLTSLSSMKCDGRAGCVFAIVLLLFGCKKPAET